MTFQSYYKVFANISAFSVLVPILIGVYRSRRLTTVFRLIMIYLVASLLAEVINHLFIAWRAATAPVETAFGIVELFTLSMVFYRLLYLSPRLQKGIVLSTGVLLILLVVQYLFLDEDVYTPLYMSLLIFLSLYFLFNTHRYYPHTTALTGEPAFWICSAVFCYFGSSLLLFTFHSFIVTASAAVGKAVWMFHLFNNLVLYVLISVGLWKLKPI